MNILIIYRLLIYNVYFIARGAKRPFLEGAGVVLQRAILGPYRVPVGCLLPPCCAPCSHGTRTTTQTGQNDNQEAQFPVKAARCPPPAVAPNGFFKAPRGPSRPTLPETHGTTGGRHRTTTPGGGPKHGSRVFGTGQYILYFYRYLLYYVFDGPRLPSPTPSQTPGHGLRRGP